MLIIRSSADLARAFDAALEPELRHLLALRRDQLTAGEEVDLSDLATFIVARCTDTLVAIETAAGFTLADHIEWVERHPGGWLEAPIITNDDGFALTVIARDCILTDPALLSALLAHA